MNTPTTATEALRQCELLWEELARTGSEDKYEATLDVLQYHPMLSCPACEYDQHKGKDLFTCGNCPVDAWRRATPDEVGAACVSPGSPFDAWISANSPEACKSAARGILELIRTSGAYHDN